MEKIERFISTNINDAPLFYTNKWALGQKEGAKKANTIFSSKCLDKYQSYQYAVSPFYKTIKKFL